MTALAFLIFVVLAIVGPGIAIQRLAKVPPDLALAIPLGILVTAGLYALCLMVSLPLLFPVFVLALDAGLLLPRPEGGFERGDLRNALLPFVVFVGILAVTEYPLNRREARGDVILDPVLPEDAAFHAGLAWELAEGYPPQVPGFSGRPMTYHFGWPLVRGAALRFAGVLPYDSLTRFDNTLGVLGLALILGAAVRAVGGSPRAATLAPWFLLASDFSFVFAWGRKIPFWITSTKGSDILLSLLQSNATVPALALGLGAVVALHRYRTEERRGWLQLAVALGLGTVFFKVFVAGQLLLGILAALVLTRERKALLWVGLPLALALALLALGPGGRGERVLLDPLVAVRDVRQAMGLGFSTEAAPWGFVLLWLVVSLGLRIVGLPGALAALWSKEGARVILAAMALSGWPLGLLFRVSPVESPDRPQNEALYFFEQSGLLLWVFVAVALGRLRLSGAKGLVAATGVALLTLPSTAQLVLHKAGLAPVRVPAEIPEAMTALAAATRPGDVLLERPRMQRFPPPPVVFIGRRVPFTSYLPFLTQWVPRGELEERLQVVQEFFRTKDAVRAREIARSLGARGVCLYGSDEVAFDTTDLQPVFENRLARVYLFKEP